MIDYTQATPTFPSPPSLGQFVAGGLALQAGRGWAWYRMAWALFIKQPMLWYIYLLIMIVAQLVCGVIPLVGGILSGLAMLYGLAALMEVAVKLHAGQDADVGDFFHAFHREYFLSMILLLGLQTLVVFVGVFVGLIAAVIMFNVELSVPGLQAILASREAPLVLGSIVLFAIPGIMLSATLNLAVPLMVINRMPLMMSVGKVFRISIGNIAPFLVSGLVSLGLSLLCLLTLGLGVLLFIPINLLLFFTIYQDIFYRSSAHDGRVG